ncbi:MAG TPA: YbdK family carboxylate-amine ligase [Solirubrobacteraceae bacterium]|nr:YbdK family carboxylate-amine ligase [Solirubrobacteraceae bacterium]
MTGVEGIAWASWSPDAAAAPWTVGVEEEVMLVSPQTWLPVSRCEDVLAALPEDLATCARAETHGSALELATAPHVTVGAATAQLADLRAGLVDTLDELGLRAAVAGTHPTARWEDVEVSPGARYQFVHASMRELARREPTFGLHVHVAVPDPESALRALNALRVHMPILLAMSGNSPFWQGRDSGLASSRTPAFQAFPRTGTARRFDSYAEYVEAIDVLVRCDAIPEPTFMWWDARLQPAFGTVEVRVMDAQTRVADTAALAALVQCLVRLEAERAEPPRSAGDADEVVAENRFIALRDGMRASLIDPPRRVRVVERLAALVEECEPVARALGCSGELARVAALAEWPGAERQRAFAARRGLDGVVESLSLEFLSERQLSSYPPAR